MSGPSPTSPRAGAFFDVDGTIVRSTIVHYYIYFRRRRMPAWLGAIWQLTFLTRCLGYLILDRIDRGRMNNVFYRRYRGLPVRELGDLARDCHRDVMRPRCFPDARRCIAEHDAAGRVVVLVTGSLDWIIAPLAEDLRVRHVLAPRLRVRNGYFTGEQDGPPMANKEKANRIRRFADEQGINLNDSDAYGDSWADLAMLESVGRPHAVNPDRKLAAVARRRGWPIHDWRGSRTSSAP